MNAPPRAFNSLIQRDPISAEQSSRLRMAAGLSEQLIIETEHCAVQEVIQRVTVVKYDGNL